MANKCGDLSSLSNPPVDGRCEPWPLHFLLQWSVTVPPLKPPPPPHLGTHTFHSCIIFEGKTALLFSTRKKFTLIFEFDGLILKCGFAVGLYTVVQRLSAYISLGYISGHFLMQELCTFFNSARNCASFHTLCRQFQRIFFSTLMRGGATFFVR